MNTLDDRIPLRFGPASAAGAGEALLLEMAAGAPAAPREEEGRAVARFAGRAPHRFGCACCGGRAPAAAALAALFQARALGRVPWFTGVLAVVDDLAAVAGAVQADLVAAARFRVER